jgi:hypothetical protein
MDNAGRLEKLLQSCSKKEIPKHDLKQIER